MLIAKSTIEKAGGENPKVPLSVLENIGGDKKSKDLLHSMSSMSQRKGYSKASQRIQQQD